jgi:hypothetical protein
LVCYHSAKHDENFTNTIQETLTDIKIIGCGGGEIDKLAFGECKTVWVKITGDCAIYISYTSGGLQKEENVSGYVTSSMGQKMKYNIGEIKSKNSIE